MTQYNPDLYDFRSVRNLCSGSWSSRSLLLQLLVHLIPVCCQKGQQRSSTCAGIVINPDVTSMADAHEGAGGINTHGVLPAGSASLQRTHQYLEEKRGRRREGEGEREKERGRRREEDNTAELDEILLSQFIFRPVTFNYLQIHLEIYLLVFFIKTSIYRQLCHRDELTFMLKKNSLVD